MAQEGQTDHQTCLARLSARVGGNAEQAKINEVRSERPSNHGVLRMDFYLFYTIDFHVVIWSTMVMLSELEWSKSVFDSSNFHSFG